MNCDTHGDKVLELTCIVCLKRQKEQVIEFRKEINEHLNWLDRMINKQTEIKNG